MNNKRMTMLTSVVCILPALAGLIMYSNLPAEIPVQWSSGGEVTNYAPKWFAVFGMPLFLLLFNVFCHIKVNRADAELSYPETAKIFIKWAMPFISVCATAFSLASVTNVSAWVALILALIGAVIILFGSLVYEGNADGIGKIDFPWSKSVNSAKVGGIILMLAGMASIIVAILGKAIPSIAVIIIGIAISMAVSSKSK